MASDTLDLVSALDSLPSGWHRLRNRDGLVCRWKSVWCDGVEWYCWGESEQPGCDYLSAELIEDGWRIA